MKKRFAILLGILLALFVIYFFGSGFVKNTSCFVEDFAVSDDGARITLRMGVASSMGYLRNVAVHQQQGGRLYLTCYSAFGGLNGSVGARDTFTFPLDEDTAVIALYRNENCYEPVLLKGEDGAWRRADAD